VRQRLIVINLSKKWLEQFDSNKDGQVRVYSKTPEAEEGYLDGDANEFSVCISYDPSAIAWVERAIENITTLVYTRTTTHCLSTDTSYQAVADKSPSVPRGSHNVGYVSSLWETSS